MDERDEKNSGLAAGRESGSAAPMPGRQTTWWLVAGIAVACAILGFFSSVRLSDSFRNVNPAADEDLAIPEAGQPAPAEVTPAAGPLDFLVGQMAQRPATVENLAEEAKRVTQCLVEGFPDDPGAHDIAARVHRQLGYSEEAVRAWERSLELNADYSHGYEGLASVADRKGEKEKAVNLLRRALVLRPDSFDSQIQLAQALIDLNRMEEAVRLLDINVATDPRPYRGRVLLGMAYTQLGEYQKAKEIYEAAIAAHPKHANAHYGLANACAQLGQNELYQEYIAKFQELRAGEREIATSQRQQFDDLDTMCVSVAQIYADAAKICIGQGRPIEAEILCSRAAVLDSGNVDCRQALAWMCSESGRHTDAIRMLEQLARLEPGSLSYRLAISRIYAAMGRLPAAEQTLRKVCEEAPKDPTGYVALANFLLSRNRNLREATEAAETAARLDPSVSNHVLLSTAYEKSDEITKAVEAMAEVVKLAPDSIRYQQIHELLKDKQRE